MKMKVIMLLLVLISMPNPNFAKESFAPPHIVEDLIRGGYISFQINLWKQVLILFIMY